MPFRMKYQPVHRQDFLFDKIFILVFSGLFCFHLRFTGKYSDGGSKKKNIQNFLKLKNLRALECMSIYRKRKVTLKFDYSVIVVRHKNL